MFPNLLAIYIDKLEKCLEDVGCVGPMLIGIVIALLLYVVDIVLLVKSLEALENQLGIIQYFCSKMGMIVNTNKTKVVKIKSKNYL